ncbi:unnamed protein product, partial [Rotaria sp. Silwood1]
SSIIQTPHITNSANNYPRKLRKETLLKKSKLSSSSTTSITRQTQIQTSTIIISPTNSIYYYSFKKSNNNNTQEIFVQFQNNKTSKQDILYPTIEDFLIVLNQSSSYQR